MTFQEEGKAGHPVPGVPPQLQASRHGAPPAGSVPSGHSKQAPQQRGPEPQVLLGPGTEARSSGKAACQAGLQKLWPFCLASDHSQPCLEPGV